MTIASEINWTKEMDSWKLSNGEEVMLSLGAKKKGARPIFLEERSFQILEKGMWNPTWYIENHRKEQILHMKFGFWSAKGRIKFRDGALYECYFKNLPCFQIVIRDLRNREDLISFQADKRKDGNFLPKMVLHQKEMFTDKLMLLLALGMALFLHYHQNEMDFTRLILLLTA